MKTLVIIPAYNEEETIKNTVDELLNEVPDVDYLVVSDGSFDNTVQICRDNRFNFLDLPINLGLAGAFQAGVKYAYRHDYDCVIQFDADGQHVPKYIKDLEEEIEDNNIVIGSRFVDSKKEKSARMFGSAILKGIIKFTTKKSICDPTSGMRAFDKRMIKHLANGMNMGPEPDTVAYLITHANAKVKEVPVTMRERQGGTSYLRFWSSAKYMIKMTISILFIQFFRKKIEE